MPSNLKLPLTVHVIDPAMLIPNKDVFVYRQKTGGTILNVLND